MGIVYLLYPHIKDMSKEKGTSFKSENELPALQEAGGSFWRSFNSLLILFEAITNTPCFSESSPKLNKLKYIYIKSKSPKSEPITNN
jgi:hypothetical protein